MITNYSDHSCYRNNHHYAYACVQNTQINWHELNIIVIGVCCYHCMLSGALFSMLSCVMVGRWHYA